MPDLHLSRHEIAAWREISRGDRERIVAHLATCAACRGVAADLERNQPADSEPERFRPEDFVARGYQVGQHRSATESARRWPWVAAAAAMIAAVLLPMWMERVEQSSALRGGEAHLELVAPVNVTVPVEKLTFEWKLTSANARVRLNVVDLDRAGEPLIEREVIGLGYEPSADEKRRFRSGQSVHWYVENLSAPGGSSATARFTVQ